MLDPELEKHADNLESQILSCRNLDQLNELAKKYGQVNHPQIGYRLGECYLILGSKESAVDHLVNSICFGCDPKNKYLQTGYADSIGQSMWHLIKNFDFEPNFDNYIYKLYCSAYYCLSVCIANMGVEAYNSLRTRALLINQFDNKVVKLVLSKYYYSEDDLCTEMLSMADYYFAAQGFLNIGDKQNSSECFILAKENVNQMIKLPQYTSLQLMSIEMFAQISKHNQDNVLKKIVLDFQNGLFQMNPNEFQEAVNGYRKKTKTGFSSWF